MNALDQLRKMTIIVEDTGDIQAIKKHRPRDATTNPSLLLTAAQLPEYKYIIDDAVLHCKKKCDPASSWQPCLERLSIKFAEEILDVISGRVSVEIDSTLSFHTKKTIETARRIIKQFEDDGYERSRILIKIASTWEGIKAAEILEKEGIHCNMTLLFSFAQAVACAEAKVRLISPFVGRILDWHKALLGVENIPASEDPGVHSVIKIYNYYKKFGYKTEIMGASFRNTEEIIELAGCDLLTISPKLLDELEKLEGRLERKLSPENAAKLEMKRISLDESAFRWMLNENAMATEKLAEGIRKFSADLSNLAGYMRQGPCPK